MLCVHPRFFVTFRHGPHKKFTINAPLTIYSAGEDAERAVGVSVHMVHTNDSLGFVLLKSEVDVVEVKS